VIPRCGGYGHEVSRDRYANLTPGAVTAALRSFPRRYRAALTSDATRDPGAVGALATREGAAVRQVLVDTAKAVELLGSGLDRVLLSKGAPTLPPVASGARVSGVDPEDASLLDLVDQLEARLDAVADRLEDAPSADLLRFGTTTAGVKLTALDIAREAVRVTAENLRLVEHATGTDQSADEHGDED
jgi:hypothetical protein